MIEEPAMFVIGNNHHGLAPPVGVAGQCLVHLTKECFTGSDRKRRVVVVRKIAANVRRVAIRRLDDDHLWKVTRCLMSNVRSQPVDGAEVRSEDLQSSQIGRALSPEKQPAPR